MSKSTFIPPKAHRLEKFKDGQGFSHELHIARNWERALDAIHITLSDSWYYIAIASNSKRGTFSPRLLKREICLDRQKQNIPKELQTILAMRLQSFQDLNDKIRDKVLTTGGANKDIWMFRSRWKEFPKGTLIVELYQGLFRNIALLNPRYHRAFVILDGRCTVIDQNDTMIRIKRVFQSRRYTEKVIRESDIPIFKSEPVSTDIVVVEEEEKREEVVRGRLPGGLVMLLLEDFDENIRTITLEEQARLFVYLDQLRDRGERHWWHDDLEVKLEKHFSRANVERRLREREKWEKRHR